MNSRPARTRGRTHHSASRVWIWTRRLAVGLVALLALAALSGLGFQVSNRSAGRVQFGNLNVLNLVRDRIVESARFAQQLTALHHRCELSPMAVCGA